MLVKKQRNYNKKTIKSQIFVNLERLAFANLKALSKRQEQLYKNPYKSQVSVRLEKLKI